MPKHIPEKKVNKNLYILTSSKYPFIKNAIDKTCKLIAKLYGLKVKFNEKKDKLKHMATLKNFN
jgi:hypothetical protein